MSDLKELAKQAAIELRTLATIAYPVRDGKAPAEHDEIWLLAEDLDNAAEVAD